MATQGEIQNFMCRPNTNDSTTLARYDQEAQHWVKAFRSASIIKPATFTGVLGNLAIVLNFIYAILWLVIFSIGRLFVWLFGSKTGGQFSMQQGNDEYPPMPTDAEVEAMFSNRKEYKIYED